MQVTAPQIKEPKTTHLVVCNEDGQAVVVMCLRLKPRGINPDHATWNQTQPSCPVCSRKWKEFK